jgi:hypothetical protein
MSDTLERLVMIKEPVWEAIEYRPHAGQKVIHASTARHRVASCGRRYGKSMLGGNELVPEALYTRTAVEELRSKGKRREFWIVGPEYSDAEKEFRQVYDRLTFLEVPFDRPGTYNNPESGDMHISLWNGRFEINAKSAKYPTTLVGESLCGVILAEAAKLKEKVWTKFLRPTLADTRGWSLHTSTPEGKNWFYRMWQRGQDPSDAQWASWRMPSWTNDVIFPGGRYDEEIIDMGKDMSDERFNQEIGADFSEFVGRVFKEFDEETHVGDFRYRPDLPLYACCDYGWTNPFVWLFVQIDDFHNDIFVIGEYRVIHRDINDIADDLRAYEITSHVKKFYPDPALPGDSAVLEKKLRIPWQGGTGGELKWRLELIRQRLKVDPRAVDDPTIHETCLHIDRSCHGLIREMQDYRYPESKEEQNSLQPEKPMDKDDHGPEALGRFMKGYFGGPAEANGRAVQRKANMGR